MQNPGVFQQFLENLKPVSREVIASRHSTRGESPLWSNSRANVASGAATEVLVILMHKVSEYVLRDPYTTRTKSATKTDDDIPSIMMSAAVKSSGSQNLGWTHLSPLWSNSRANVASGAATEVLVILMHKVSEYVLRDPYTTRTRNVNARA